MLLCCCCWLAAPARLPGSPDVVVTITGTNIVPGFTLFIGSAPCPVVSTIVASPLVQLRCLYPANAGGLVDVFLLDPVTGRSAGQVTFLAEIGKQSLHMVFYLHECACVLLHLSMLLPERGC